MVIYSVGGITPQATTFTSKRKQDYQTRSVMPREEKKSNHAVRNFVGLAVVAAGVYFLTRGKGKKIIEKIKNFIQDLKPANPTVNPENTGLKPIKITNTATPRVVNEEVINDMVGLNRPINSAQESASVFTQHGLTDTEKALIEAEKNANPKASKPRKQTAPKGTMPETKTKPTKKKSTATKSTDSSKATKTKRKTTNTRKRTSNTKTKTQVLEPKVQITEINEPRRVDAQVIEEMVGLNRPVKSAQESAGVFIKRDVEQRLAQQPVITSETIDAGLGLNRPTYSAKESARFYSEMGLTDTEKAFNAAERQQTRPPRRTNSAYEPSKRKVIRQHSNLVQGEVVKPGSKTNARKIRHNKKRIINEAQNNE